MWFRLNIFYFSMGILLGLIVLSFGFPSIAKSSPPAYFIPTLPLLPPLPNLGFRRLRRYKHTPTPTSTPTPTITPTPTPSPSLTPSPTPSISPTPSSTPTPTPTPLAYWKMEEGSGNEINDSSGNGNDLTALSNPNPPLWSSDIPPTSLGGNYSLFFDGDNYAKSALSSSDLIYDFTSGFTVEAWIKTDSSGSQDTDKGIIAKWGDNKGWAMIIPGTKIVNAINNVRLISASTVNDDKWHHVAITWDGSKQFIYIDGEQEGFLTSNQSPQSSEKTFYLATYQPPDHNFKGYMDEVKIYGYPRGQEEIIQDAGI